jgi:ABC-type arginine transport system permease subunit
MRRIVLPQPVTRVIPRWPRCGWAFRAREIATGTYRPLEIFTVIAVIYFALTLLQSIGVNALYRRFRTQE